MDEELGTYDAELERFNLSLSVGKVGVWDWDIRTNNIYLSPNLKAILGYEDHEIPNDIDTWVTYVHPEDSEYVMHEATKYMEGKTPKYEVYHRMVHKDGSVRWILVRGKAIKDEDGNAYRMIGVDIDVTERTHADEELQKYKAHLEQLVESRTAELKQTQSQLVQTAKLASLGEMATGIAHELNNPLGIISMSTEMSQLAIKEGRTDRLEKHINEILEQTRRAKEIISHLKQFGRKVTDIAQQEYNLISVIDNALLFFKNDFNVRSISIERNLEGQCVALKGSAVQIEQVFVNLLSNARDAMEGYNNKKITINIGAEAGQCIVRFSDTGSGVSKKDLPHIFDPFFTTKDVGEGTGLGLSISYGIIRDHGGSIEVQDRETGGVTFIIRLPTGATECRYW